VGRDWNRRSVLLEFTKSRPNDFAPTSARTPPVRCTTEDPAKSTCPCPIPKFEPNVASQPPPHTQLP
jgi:hypothetical protein